MFPVSQECLILVVPSGFSNVYFIFSKVVRSPPWLGWPLCNICVTNDHIHVPLVINTSRSFPHSWNITGFVTRLTRRMNINRHKTKDRVIRTPLKTGGDLRCSGRVSSSCSTSGIRRVNLVTNPVIFHEWGKDQEVIMTSGTYMWSFVTQILKTKHTLNTLCVRHHCTQTISSNFL
jgi:hypothetical protein